MSEGTATNCSPVSCARPFATDQPTRSPVKLPGPSLDDDAFEIAGGNRDASQREVDKAQHLRGVTPRALDVRAALGRHRTGSGSPADRDARDVGRGVDREPGTAGQASSTMRTSGSGSCASRKWRSSGGAQGPARSGHSMRTMAPSRVMSSKPRSRASSGERSR